MIGIDYPTISVGKHENLTVRHSLAAQVLMRRRGLDPANLIVLLSPVLWIDGKPTTQRNPDSVINALTAFSCQVAENFLDHSQPHRVNLDIAPTVDYWSIVGCDDFPAIEKVVCDAIKKFMEAKRTKLEAAPPQEAAS